VHALQLQGSSSQPSSRAPVMGHFKVPPDWTALNWHVFNVFSCRTEGYLGYYTYISMSYGFYSS
jgi:hypothetical protein